MQKLLKKLGYNGEVLNHVTKRVCGIWFIWIGVIEAVGVLFGGSLCINPLIFIIGYSLGFYLCYGNKKFIYNKVANGKESSFQHKSSDIAIYALIVLCSAFGIINWSTHQEPKIIWLCMLMATGIHFLLFYFVHGRVVIFLGILCIAYSATGLICSSVPFWLVGYIDSATKVCFGIIMLLSKVTTNEKSSYRKLFV